MPYFMGHNLYNYKNTLQRQQALMARNDQLLTDISNFKSEFTQTNNQYQQAQRQIKNHKQKMQQKATSSLLKY